MKKNRIRLFVLVLALTVALSGCMANTLPAESDASNDENTPPIIVTAPYPEETSGPAYEWIADCSPIPSRRIGLHRQGITSLANGFECTDTGVYFMCDTSGDGSYLFYGDHGSSTIIKLCGRPDCDHNNEDCNAYFAGGNSICYYNGYLYTVASEGHGLRLIQMDLDGSNRVTVTDTSSIEGNIYKGSDAPVVWNGIFTCALTYLDENGHTQADSYIYKLDGSMDTPELGNVGLPWQNDGNHFIMFDAPIEDPYKYGLAYSIWDPNSNEVQFLSDMMGIGYYGMEDAYYIRNGIVYHLNYADGQEEILLETGLDEIKFEYLHCFPDHFVINVRLGDAELETTSNPILYFYNWNYDLLGQAELDFPHAEAERYFICGESAERIILTDNIYKIPRYYIEKSDFGTGNIEIHEYNMPDIDWDEISG